MSKRKYGRIGGDWQPPNPIISEEIEKFEIIIEDGVANEKEKTNEKPKGRSRVPYLPQRKPLKHPRR
ncbi:hypothetical protein JXA63_01160 [Candidatus Woesebacteria bacterium]|nr:hypothetical protein [Candidatus Woesebacteria bacterium]